MRQLLPIIASIGMILAGLIALSYFSPKEGADIARCGMLYMNPAYSRVVGFDDSHTKFAKKYSLYLYREEDVDPMPANDDDGFVHLDGVPLLFIPGNAGSYRQVRSIAGETASTYFHHYVHDGDTNANAQNYDVFTADFNEDFTAFHGRTMLDQAEYLNEAIRFILDLYSQNENPPTAVVVVGHLMGGIVARTMVTLPNYVDNSINTILTLASPHAASPLTFDGDLIRLYSGVDRFWYDGYNLPLLVAHQRLANLSLVSITGGILDDTLPADYTTLGFLVPATNGFTTYTTGISEVWTPIDHLAIVWCHQLRKRLAQVLLDITDRRQPLRTYPLEKRMAIFRKHLLTGFEDYAIQDKKVFAPADFTITRDSVEPSTELRVGPGPRGSDSGNQITVFTITNNTGFSFLSSVPPTAWKEYVSAGYINPLVLFCRQMTKRLKNHYDVSTRKNSVTEECVDASLDFNVVPHPGMSLYDSSYSGDAVPYYAYVYNSSAVADWDKVVILDRLNSNDDATALVAQTFPSQRLYVVGGSIWSLILGAKVTLPETRPLTVDVAIPGAWSLILAYSVRLRPQLVDGSNPLIPPMVRQWSDDPFESKWHMQGELDHLVITKHGIAPYIPFKVSLDPTHWGINLQIWQLANSPLEVTCTIDWMASLKLLVLRYRLSLVALCVLIVLMVMVIQIKVYQFSRKWPDFISSLAQLTSWPVLPVVLLVLVVLTPLTKIRVVQEALDLIDPVVIRDSNEINILIRRDYLLNSFYLGLEELVLLFLGPLFFFIGVALVFAVAVLISAISHALRRLIPSTVLQETSDEEKEQHLHELWYKRLWKLRRLVVIALVLVLVPIYVPYPVVYVTCVVLQALKVGHYAVTELASNFNFQVTLLILFLWVLPINIPILVVFVHNIAVNWTTPFASHHNLLSILPILAITRIRGIPNFGKNRYTRVVLAYLWYCIGYCVIYGVRHTFWIHHLINLLCCILILGYFD